MSGYLANLYLLWFRLFVYKKNVLIYFCFITNDVNCATPQTGFTLGTFFTV